MFLAASPPLFGSSMGHMDSTGYQSSLNNSSLGNYRLAPSFYATNASAMAAAYSSLAAGINALDFSTVTNNNNRPVPVNRGSAFNSSLKLPRHSASAPDHLNLLERRAARQKISKSIGGGGGGSAVPLRSCLVVRPELALPVAPTLSDPADSGDGGIEVSATTDACFETTQLGAKSSNKKRVVFADDKGLSLTQVKMMTEPSDCPPRWTVDFLEQVTGGASASVSADRWEVTFPQPASDYLDFRSRIDTQNIALENVVVQEADQVLVGTIKVKNLSFSKLVTVRVTFDQWTTHQDVVATFNPCTMQGSGQSHTVNLFDTFSFKVAIPASSSLSRIEFCLCYKCDSGEFWDNNKGKNFIIAKRSAAAAGATQDLMMMVDKNRRNGKFNFTSNALSTRLDYWTEFSCLNHLNNDSPYW